MSFVPISQYDTQSLNDLCIGYVESFRLVETRWDWRWQIKKSKWYLGSRYFEEVRFRTPCRRDRLYRERLNKRRRK